MKRLTDDETEFIQGVADTIMEIMDKEKLLLGGRTRFTINASVLQMNGLLSRISNINRLIMDTHAFEDLDDPEDKLKLYYNTELGNACIKMICQCINILQGVIPEEEEDDFDPNTIQYDPDDTDTGSISTVPKPKRTAPKKPKGILCEGQVRLKDGDVCTSRAPCNLRVRYKEKFLCTKDRPAKKEKKGVKDTGIPKEKVKAQARAPQADGERVPPPGEKEAQETGASGAHSTRLNLPKL